MWRTWRWCFTKKRPKREWIFSDLIWRSENSRLEINSSQCEFISFFRPPLHYHKALYGTPHRKSWENLLIRICCCRVQYTDIMVVLSGRAPSSPRNSASFASLTRSPNNFWCILRRKKFKKCDYFAGHNLSLHIYSWHQRRKSQNLRVMRMSCKVNKQTWHSSQIRSLNCRNLAVQRWWCLSS